MDGGLADGIEQVPLLPSRKGREGDGSVHGPKGGGADGAGVGAVMAGQDGDAVDVPQPALVGTHSQVGVPLDVLDGIVTLPRRGQDVGGGDVHEGVHELLGGPRNGFHGRDDPERPDRVPLLGFHPWGRPREHAVAVACGVSGFGTCPESLRETVPELETPPAGSRRPLRLDRGARNEAGRPGIVDRSGAGLGVELDIGVPAAGDSQQIAFQATDSPRNGPAVLAQGHDPDPPNPLCPLDVDDGVPMDDLKAPFPGLGAAPAGRPCIHDGSHLRSGIQQVESRPVGAVVVGEDHCPGAG